MDKDEQIRLMQEIIEQLNTNIRIQNERIAEKVLQKTSGRFFMQMKQPARYSGRKERRRSPPHTCGYI